MNARELADKMDTKGFRYREVKAAVVMLRQQAQELATLTDRIAVLEANHKIQLGINEKALQYIAELEKQVDAVNTSQEYVDKTENNRHEPVAWLVQYKNRHEFKWSKPEHLYEALAVEPLYTTPHHASDVKQTKPLTEPEIHWIAQRFFHSGLGIDPVKFAKAIEERILGK